MIRKFTKEGRFECGLDALVAGKVWAFTAVTNYKAGPAFVLGAAVANEPGYYPIPVHWAWGDDYGELSDHADELNAEMGIDADAGVVIVSSTMQGSIAKRRREMKRREIEERNAARRRSIAEDFAQAE